MRIPFIGLWLAVGLLTASLSGQTFSDSDIPRDNVEGNYILHEIGPIQPMAVRGNVLVTLNQPMGRMVFYALSPFQKLWETPVGLGANSVAEVPGRPFEYWVTDSVQNCVTVWSPQTLDVAHTIPTAAAPHGIVFNADGSRAYVTCSAGRTIEVIDTATYQVVESFPVPARRPRALAFYNSRIYYAPFLSGNNTAALGAGGFNFVKYIPDLAAQGAIPLDDIDLRVLGEILPGGGNYVVPIPTERRQALGTVLFNIERRPGTSELWLCNTDALNADFIGEPNMPQGQVVSNRITIVDVSSPVSTPPTVVDLDQIAIGTSCAQPRAVAFNAAGDRAYVACEGSDVIAVLDGAGQWLGYYHIAEQGDVRSMPGGVVVAGDLLITYNRGTNSLSVIDTTTVPLGATINDHRSLGLDPRSAEVLHGRSIIHDADRSASGRSSCASCHVDGDLDGVVWDLSGTLDPEGTPENQLSLWTDRKGPMVTQSLRGLPETAGFHWRGERGDVEFFNVAFVGLFDGNLLTPSELDDMVAYVNELRYPANPHQAFDRVTTPGELEGARIFVEELATVNRSCNDCHTLPLGTNGELLHETTGFAESFIVPQLRNVADKELGLHDYGNLTTASGMTIDLGEGSDIGPALLHNGSKPTLFKFSLDEFVNIDATEAGFLEEFMRAFDTGLAPSTGFQATMTQDNVLGFTAMTDLIAQADAGNCDLVFSGSIALPTGRLWFQGMYERATGFFVFDTETYGSLTPSIAPLLVAAGYGAWTFRGVPVGAARRYSIDWDMDGRRNTDEVGDGTDPLDPDTDGDGFPDGYEHLWGMNPLVPDSSSPDMTAPTMTMPDVIFANTNTVKIRVLTDENAVVTADWTSKRGAESARSPAFGPHDTRHTFVLNFLPHNAVTSVTLTATDPAGNATTQVISVTTSDELTDKLFVQSEALSLSAIGITPGSPIATTSLQADVALASRSGTPIPAGYDVVAFVYLENGPGNFSIVQASVTATTDGSGVAHFSVPFTFLIGQGQNTIHFGVIDVNPSTGSGLLDGYVEGLDVENVKTLVF